MFFSITDCWVMELNGKVAAGVFYTTVPNSSETLLVTTFYEPEYEKYCIGIITLYHSIKELINKKITRIHMGRNDVDYKKNARCTGHELYVGFITPNPILYLVHKIRRKLMKFIKKC
ncbi:MAG: GNAT family N-acetyltransferase [Acetobacter sp.]|nr:GNAT family N-acetyltransferase [Acetobacter sp.]